MKNNKLQEIGKRIARLRKSKEMTQQQLAELLFVSDKTISKWERGVGAPDLSLLQNLANNLGVTVEELISGEKTNKSNDSTVEGIKIYISETKKKTIIKVIKIFICIIFCFTVFYFAERNSRWEITYFNAKGDFKVSGYAFYNNKETKLIIDEFYYDNNTVGTIDEIKTNYLKVSLISNETEIYSKTLVYEKYTAFSECFHNYYLIYENKERMSKKELENLFIRINYKDESGNYNNIDIYI